ncbi:MAG: PIN domain-containing protein [Gaiellaceae bacterium]
MAQYLADTSAWNRSRLVSERWSAMVEADELLLCTPVRLEILYSARGGADYAQFARDLARFPHLALDGRAERAARRTQAALARRGHHRGPTPIDLLVAAVAEVNGATLLHYDRHFDLIARVTDQPVEWLPQRGSLD